MLSVRNNIAHELFKVLLEYEEDYLSKLFVDFISIYKKIDKWYLNNIEIPIIGDDIPDNYDKDGVVSGVVIMLDILLDTVYGENKFKNICDLVIH